MAQEPKAQNGSSTNEDIKALCPKGFFMTFGWAYAQANLKGVSLADMGLYGLIGLFGTYNAETNTFQRCRPSRARLARIAGCSPSKIDRSLASLVNAGLLQRHERHAEDGSQLPSEYTVVCGEFKEPAGMSNSVEKSTSKEGGLSHMTNPLVTCDEGGVVTYDKGGLSHMTNNQEALNPNSVNPENPPRSFPASTSPCETREESQKRGDLISKKSKADNPDVVQAILDMPGIRTNMSHFGEARLRVAVEACRQRGITDQQMISAVGERSFEGVRYLERALTARLEALEVPTPTESAKKARCALHGHSDALHCPSCWGTVKAGGDPYEGHEDLRPEGWHDAFAWSPSVKTVTADETEVEPLNLPAAIMEMFA